MRSLLVTLLVLGLCLVGFIRYREHVRANRNAASFVIRVEPAAPTRSLEERAAAAQGTTLPPQAARQSSRPDPQFTSHPSDERVGSAAAAESYHCDGRSYCSQMHSCAEAKWFLQHCPGMNMDGEGDGVPCERQWCKHPFSP